MSDRYTHAADYIAICSENCSSIVAGSFITGISSFTEAVCRRRFVGFVSRGSAYAYEQTHAHVAGVGVRFSPVSTLLRKRLFRAIAAFAYPHIEKVFVAIIASSRSSSCCVLFCSGVAGLSSLVTATSSVVCQR